MHNNMDDVRNMYQQSFCGRFAILVYYSNVSSKKELKTKRKGNKNKFSFSLSLFYVFHAFLFILITSTVDFLSDGIQNKLNFAIIIVFSRLTIIIVQWQFVYINHNIHWNGCIETKKQKDDAKNAAFKANRHLTYKAEYKKKRIKKKGRQSNLMCVQNIVNINAFSHTPI